MEGMKNLFDFDITKISFQPKPCHLISYLGSTVEIFARKFLITGADVAVYRYMEKRPQKFRPEVMESVKQYLQREGIIDDESKEIEHVTMNEEHVNESL